MKKKNYIVLGYYDRSNLGDEAYKTVFTTYFDKINLTFKCVDDINTININNYDGIIIGGGDLVNDYFHNKYYSLLDNFKGIVIGVSLGFPFKSMITHNYLNKFHHIFTRNYEELRPLQRTIGCYKAHYMPDLTFLLDNKNLNYNKFYKKTCGIFLISNLLQYPNIIMHLARLFSLIANNYNIIFYRFDTSNTENDDTNISKKILDLLQKKFNKCLDTHSNYVDLNNYNANEMLNVIAKLDFAVCLRYHSHIFCMLANVPFLSISSTKKTRSLMSYAKLSRWQYEIPLNCYGTPQHTYLAKLVFIYREIINEQNYFNIKQDLCNFVNKCKYLLDHKQMQQLIIQHDLPLNDDINMFMSTYNDVENTSRVLVNKILGYPDSVYNWGIISKLKNMSNNVYDVIKEAIEYLLNIKHDNIIHEELINKETKQINLTIKLSEYNSYKNVHRGGWYLAIESLSKIMTDNGVLCDMYIDRTFHWCNNYYVHTGYIPYTIPWCGFIHHTLDITQSQYNVIELFKNKYFIQSLATCVMLFTLSEPLTEQLKPLLKNYDIPVITFMHPIVNPNHYFTMSNYNLNTNKKLIQIGAWLRNYFTIYTLDLKLDLQKCILIGKNMEECKLPVNLQIELIENYKSDNAISNTLTYKYIDDIPCRGEILETPRIILHIIEWIKYTYQTNNVLYSNNILYVENEVIKSNIINIIQQNNVEYISYVNNDDYDLLLHNNIIFLHLIDVAACNVIIEAIIRNTPILLNKTPGTVHLLGDNYPLFYQNIQDINNVLTFDNIYAAHIYLTKLDKTQYSIEYFVNNIKKHII